MTRRRGAAIDNEVVSEITYVCPCLQLFGVNGILMKAWPLLECVKCNALIFFIVPLQHFGLIRDTNALAIGGDHACGIIQEIICVDHAKFYAFGNIAVDESIGLSIHFAICCAIRCTIRGAIRYSSFSSVTWANLSNEAQVFEDAADFIVTSFGRVKAEPACHFV